MENQTIFGRVLLQLLKIVVTSRLDQHVLLNIYFTLGSNMTKLACALYNQVQEVQAQAQAQAQVYPKQHMLQYDMWSQKTYD